MEITKNTHPSAIFSFSPSESDPSLEEMMALDTTLRRCLAVRPSSSSTTFFFFLESLGSRCLRGFLPRRRSLRSPSSSSESPVFFRDLHGNRLMTALHPAFRITSLVWLHFCLNSTQRKDARICWTTKLQLKYIHVEIFHVSLHLTHGATHNKDWICCRLCMTNIMLPLKGNQSEEAWQALSVGFLYF